MSTNFRQILTLSLFGFILIIQGCSTEKDAPLNKGYHNMTARYNGYFNARMMIEESLESYRQASSEDYTKILPLDLYPTAEDIPMIQEKYETALEKCEKVIFRHSMPSSATRNKAEENCRWIDDNWFVIGQIHYTRQDYIKAEEIFKFIQETALYVDQERVHEARIWLAKTYIALKKFPEAKRYLAQVEIDMESAGSAKEDKKEMSSREKKKQKEQDKKDKKKGLKKKAPFPKHLKDDYEITMAEFWIAQKDYKKAIEHLEKGIQLVKKKKRKSRYMFVLAQLYQKTGNGDQAAFYFNKVVHSNVKYEMRFQAQIYKALTATSGGQEIRKELTKMLRDPKNDEFRDQIYYALAELEIKDGNKELAIEYYTKSAFTSIKNNRQKGLSYLKLGDLYFAEPDYLKAQKYYDSCVQVLPEEYEDYEQIKGKAEGLSDLVFHYETYVYEDSVQHIANMSETEREKFLEKTLQQIKDEDERRKEEEQRRLKEQQNRIKNSSSNSGSGSKWYFYNQKVSSSGFNEFRALWGQRVSEDDWRRSNKTTYATDDLDNPDSQDSTEVVENITSIDSLSVDDLRKGIPLTETAMDSSNFKMINSLYMLGIIYKEQLSEPDEAIKYFSEVIIRKIEHPKVLPANYQLYLLYKKKGSAKAEQYKNTILSEYPDSEIAMILKDPEYLEKKAEKEREELNEYSNTLDDYRYHRFQKVIVKCNEVIANDKDNEYLNKYYLLKAFSIGKTQAGNTNAVRGPLEELYNLSPDSEEGLEAKIYLEKIKKGQSIVEVDTTNVSVPSPYTYDENLEHYFVLVFPLSEGNANATKIKISNFNKEFFRSKQLTITDAQLGEEFQLLVIRTFKDLEDAKKYKMGFNSTSAKPTLGNIPTKFETFLINGINFSKMFESKDLKGYQEFYKEKYPQ